ncbi:transcription antitermination factor NusB [Caloramator sp. E03]|uniref:transcription antitermination factor NusB n=1 Tax=Caloramator sp. E03 TaxID=2576307 RepID=UPI001110DD4B|nr:transcription antitermination factor NusB [Caloramator sp. E03]QCX32697.1 transcription antitermination factor NusB [Caloramator sp. E03]
MSRKLARETAMTLIYQMNVNNSNASEVLESFIENSELELSKDDVEYLKNCLEGVENRKKEIDGYIERYLKPGWKMGRIAKVDLAILRLGVYEMLYREDVPNVVAVNEAIELAKKYSTDESRVFINGVLGNILREIK